MTTLILAFLWGVTVIVAAVIMWPRRRAAAYCTVRSGPTFLRLREDIWEATWPCCGLSEIRETTERELGLIALAHECEQS